MPEIDRELIIEARKFITGANVHMLKTWLFCYETSLPGTARSSRYETLLRDFVSSKRLISKAKAQVMEQRDRLFKLDTVIGNINRMIERSRACRSD